MPTNCHCQTFAHPTMTTELLKSQSDEINIIHPRIDGTPRFQTKNRPTKPLCLRYHHT
jgi:hypothetical protein